MQEHLHVLVFREGRSLVAQVIDFDLAAQAPTWSELAEETQRILMAHMLSARERGPFPCTPAPNALVDRFMQAKRVLGYRVSKLDDASWWNRLPQLVFRTDDDTIEGFSGGE